MNLEIAAVCDRYAVIASIMFHVANKPVEYARGNLSALGGGTSPTVTMLYLGVRP